MSIGKKIAHKPKPPKAPPRRSSAAPPATPACAPRAAPIRSRGNTKQAGAKVKDAFKH